VVGVDQKTIDRWEGASNIPENNTCNPPDLRIGRGGGSGGGNTPDGR